MPKADNSIGYHEEFYKEAVTGKKGNLYTRVAWLEDALRRLAVGDITQYISQVIYDNKRIVVPSVLGGNPDPTASDFSGIVIDPDGQIIDGITYSFAIVIDGVVFTGFGNDGGTPVIVGTGGDVVGPASAIVGNLAMFDSVTGKVIADSGISSLTVGTGDVISDTPSSTPGNLALFTDIDGKHIGDYGVNLMDIVSRDNRFWFSDDASGISTFKSLVADYADATSGSVTENCLSTVPTLVETFITPELGVPVLLRSPFYPTMWASVDVNQTLNITLQCKKRTAGGTISNLVDFSIGIAGTGTPQVLEVGNSFGWIASDLVIDPTDRIIVNVYATVGTTANVTIYYGDDATPSYVAVPNDVGSFGSSYTDEMAQDAIGNIIDASLVYDDSAPSLSRAALTGDVTAAEGDNATTIANDAVTLAKIQNIATDSFIGRDTVGTGDPEVLSAATARSVLNVENGAEANNISDTDATDLTDGGMTLLHAHLEPYQRNWLFC